MRVALSTLDGGRIGIAAQAVGIAQAALDVAVGYAQERQAFGRAIGGFQAISQRLADMQTEIGKATWMRICGEVIDDTITIDDPDLGEPYTL
jgi:alkylation response protein AidB-like acyl-CoA dehydrogenase